MDTIYDIRRRNLKQYIEEHGGPTSVAKQLGLSSASYLSQITGSGRNRDLTEKPARRFEEALGLPERWFDEPRQTPARRSVEVREPKQKVYFDRKSMGTTATDAARVIGLALETLAGDLSRIPQDKLQTFTTLSLEKADMPDPELKEYMRKLAELLH